MQSTWPRVICLINGKSCCCSHYYQIISLDIHVWSFRNNNVSMPSWDGIIAAAAKSLQSCPTLCNPMDCSPPGPSIHGIFQAKALEWVPSPSPMHESEKRRWSCSVMSDPQRLHGLQPTRPLCPWDFPGKSTGVGAIAFSDSTVWTLYFIIPLRWFFMWIPLWANCKRWCSEWVTFLVSLCTCVKMFVRQSPRRGIVG